MSAPEEAAKLRGELGEATRTRDKALETLQATEKELEGLLTAKRSLEESVKAEQDACSELHRQLDEGKGEHRRLRNEAGKLKEDLQRRAGHCKKHEEEIMLLRKSVDGVTTALPGAKALRGSGGRCTT